MDISKVWLTLSSVIVAFSFVFGTSFMQMFQTVVLLFVVHPFDVGDALMIPTNASVTGTPDYVIVEELSLQVGTVCQASRGDCLHGIRGPGRDWSQMHTSCHLLKSGGENRIMQIFATVQCVALHDNAGCSPHPLLSGSTVLRL